MLEILEVPPIGPALMAVIDEESKLILLMVLFEMVLVGKFEAPAKLNALSALAELAVILEKLLLLQLMIAPVADAALARIKLKFVVVVVNPVTILLELMVCVPVAVTTTASLIKVIAPVVAAFKLVKELPLMFCDKVAAEFKMYW